MSLSKTTYLSAAFYVCFLAAADAQPTAATPAVTAVPRLVRFAGSLPSAINPPAGTAGASFAIYAEPQGGTPLWTEAQNDLHLRKR